MRLPTAVEIRKRFWRGSIILLYLRRDIFLGKLVLIQLFTQESQIRFLIRTLFPIAAGVSPAAAALSPSLPECEPI